MEWFDRNISAADSALQERPKVFDPVGMDFAAHVLFRVVNHVMNVLLGKLAVRAKRVTVNGRASFYVLIDCAVKRFALSVRHNHSADLTVTFQQSHNSHLASGLISASTTGSGKFRHALCQNRLVHVPRFAADKSFVNFNVTAKLLFKRSSLHRQADAVLHKPRSLLSNTDSPVYLVRANTVLRAGNHPNGSQPLIQAKRGILENGSSLKREGSALVMARTLPAVVLWLKRHARAIASRTDNAIRPATRHKVVATILRFSEIDNRLLECFG